MSARYGVPAAFLLRFALSLALDNQSIVVNFYFHLVLVQAGQFGANHQIAFLFANLDGRRPLPDFAAAGRPEPGKHPVQVVGKAAHEGERADRKQLFRASSEQAWEAPLTATAQSAAAL